MASIVSTLGVGSGIDTKALIDQLVAADRTARATPLTTRSDALTAQISALGQIKSGMQGLAASLSTRVTSGALGLQPVSSDSGVATIVRSGIGPRSAYAASITVTALASAQRLVAAPLAGSAAAVGLGTLTIGLGRRTPLAGGGFSFAAGSADAINITIDATNNSLTGLRDAINRAGAGVTASIVTSGGSATLALKGNDGADNGFVISAAEDAAAPGLARFAYTPGNASLSLTAGAADAALTVDGVAVTRSSNTIDDLITGTRIVLKKPGSTDVSAARDSSALESTLSDLATTLEAFRSLVADLRKPATNTDPAGALASDPTARGIAQRVASLLANPVAAANGLRLRDLGITAARDGSIQFDPAPLAALSPQRQADAETLLRSLSAPAGNTPYALQAIAGLVTPASDGLTRRKTAVASDLAAVETRLTAYRDTLTRQYAAMDALVAASKAVGTQLDQQIKIWTNSSNR